MPVSAATLDMIERLIAFDTTSRNSNLELIEFVRDYLAGHGVDSTLVHDAEAPKANLYATLGDAQHAGIALSGHTDVVPVDGQDWSSDPFRVETRDGRLYGRGTSDMKAFIAVCLAMVPEFKARRLRLPVHLALSFDEEVGCIGVRRLIDVLREAPVKPLACIVGEPTSMQIIRAHKGKLSTRCRVRGFEVHSSLAHQGANAVQAAAEVVAYMTALARSKRDHGPFDDELDPPYTTVHTGTMRGGTALNIVPRECSFEFEFRYVPADDPHAILADIQAFAHEQVEPALKAVHPDCGFAWETMSAIPALDTAEDEPVVQLVKAITGRNATGKVAFGTEAGLFQEVGIPTVICGPGSIEQAHKPDEWVSLAQVAECEAFMRGLMDRLESGQVFIGD